MKKVLFNNKILCFILIGLLFLSTGLLAVHFNNDTAVAQENNAKFEIVGASVRLSEPTGIRFTTVVANELKQPDRKFGTLIIPEKDFGVGDIESLSKDTPKVLNIATSKWHNLEGQEDKYNSVLGGIKVQDVIQNFPVQQYNSILLAKSYYVDGEQYTYTKTIKRSLAQVASMALASETLDSTQQSVLSNICDAVLKDDGFVLNAVQFASSEIGTIKDVNLFFDETNGSEGLTAKWEIVSGNNVELSVDDKGIVGGIKLNAIGTTTLRATIGSKTAEMTVEVLAPVTLDKTYYYDMNADSFSINLQQDLNDEIVEKIEIDNKNVTFTGNTANLVIDDIKNQTGYLTHEQVGNKKVQVTTDKNVYIFDSVFVSKIIRNSDVNGDPEALRAILYDDNHKIINDSNWGGYYVLGEDITLDDSKFALKIAKLTSTAFRFNGIIDGLGHKIINYKVGQEGALLPFIGNRAIIRNINFENALIGNGGAGGLINVINYGGLIENIKIDVVIGAVGYNGMICRDNNGKIKNCIVEVEDKGWTQDRHGYFVKTNNKNCTIDNSYAVVRINKATPDDPIKYGKLVVTNNGAALDSCKMFTSYEEMCADSIIIDNMIQNGFNNYWKIDKANNTISMITNANNIL